MSDETGKQNLEGQDDPPRVQSEFALRSLNVFAGSRQLLRDASAEFPAGKITVIVGASGAGKSILLRILAGLIPRVGDAIRWTGDIGDATKKTDQPRVGVVFQQFALFDELSATANVQFAMDHRPKGVPVFDTGSSEESDDANRWSSKDWLEHLGVPIGTPVSALSGGQKQRLAIARTLAGAPDLLLYDEPTSGLDAASGRLVAQLIADTQEEYGRTSIVVTHDYETLLPIADKVLLLDADQAVLLDIPKSQWRQVPDRMSPIAARPSSLESSERSTKSDLSRTVFANVFETIGGAVIAAVRLPWDLIPIVPRLRWAARFTLHYLRLVAGPSAWIYLIISGLIIGFTSTYFTFRFLPFRLYTEPLLIDELLASIGFALYRVLVPILATILVAARCGAAVSADVGVKQYGGQVDALKTFGVQPRSYLLMPIVIAFLVGTPVLEALAFYSAQLISMIAFTFSYSDVGPYFWQQHFSRNIAGETAWLHDGWQWVLAKNLVCGLGTGVIAYYQGLSPKRSASDVSRAITSTVLWTTLFVLVVHFVVALLEF